MGRGDGDRRQQEKVHGMMSQPRSVAGGSPATSAAAGYSALETLRNGRRLEIRALKPEDQAGLLGAVNRASAQSLMRRFFVPKRQLTAQEIAFFMNVDFVKHVALLASLEQDGQQLIVGGGRYILVEPGLAELAFVVVDTYQGLGIGAALLRHLAMLARNANLQALVAEVLPENAPMLKVFDRSGYRLRKQREADVVHVTLYLD
jgi:RimJ/RimL family protein N-acetyltransferase